MRRSAARDFVVGLFVLAGLGAIAYLSMNVGGFSLRERGGLIVFGAFDETGGLKPRAPVVIAGVKVGQVDSISLGQDFRARVQLDLDPNLKLPIDTSASIVTAGLLGDMLYWAARLRAHSLPGHEVWQRIQALLTVAEGVKAVVDSRPAKPADDAPQKPT